MQNGALVLRGESPQAGYMRPMSEDGKELVPNEVIARLGAFTPPPPNGVLPNFRLPSDRQTPTDSSDSLGKTGQDSCLVIGEDGKPIFGGRV